MTSPRNVFSATQTPDEGGSGVGAPLLDSAAVCALLGVQRNALARYRAAGLPFVVLAPGVYRYRREDLDAWLAAHAAARDARMTEEEKERRRENMRRVRLMSPVTASREEGK